MSLIYQPYILRRHLHCSTYQPVIFMYPVCVKETWIHCIVQSPLKLPPLSTGRNPDNILLLLTVNIVTTINIFLSNSRLFTFKWNTSEKYLTLSVEVLQWPSECLKKLLWKKCALNWKTQKQPRKVWFVCCHCDILINIWDLLLLTKSQEKSVFISSTFCRHIFCFIYALFTWKSY